jgi:hypothetical protein
MQQSTRFRKFSTRKQVARILNKLKKSLLQNYSEQQNCPSAQSQ